MPFKRLPQEDKISQEELVAGNPKLHLYWHLRPHKDCPQGPMGDGLYLETNRGDKAVVLLLLDAMSHGVSSDALLKIAENFLFRVPELQQQPCPCSLLQELLKWLLTNPLFRGEGEAPPYIFFDATVVFMQPERDETVVWSCIGKSLYRRESGIWVCVEVGEQGFSLNSGPDLLPEAERGCSPIPLTPRPSLLLGTSDWTDDLGENGRYNIHIANDLGAIPTQWGGQEVLEAILDRAERHHAKENFPPDDLTLFCLEWKESP
jgi:hypothetical protein